MKKIVLVLIAAFAITACAHKAVVKNTPEQNGNTTSENRKENSLAAQPGSNTAKKGIGDESVTGKVKSEDEIAARQMKALQAAAQDIHFDFDRYDIRNTDKPSLKKLSGLLSNEKKVKILIEGNCDERGTAEYNLALGDRRANEAKKYLEALGIPAGRLETVSYGSEKPVCHQENEECWSKNRRDHFVLNTAK